MENIYSLQGSMAVGKTTALNYIAHKNNNINCCYEDNLKVIKEIQEKKLDKNLLDDYLQIQKLWIQNEIKRAENCPKNKLNLMDFGAEEIEFYTLNYPKLIGKDWDIESLLKEDLDNLRIYYPKKILFLTASYETLLRNKKNDKNRTRTFFDYQYQHLFPLKKKWFKDRANVDFLDVDNLSADEVGNLCLSWISNFNS